MGFFSSLGNITSAIGAVTNPISGLISGGASLLGGIQRNEASAKQAMLANEFSERMASTQHQREVADLRAAGLNPILSAGHPGAASPVGQKADMQDVMTPAVSSALDAQRTRSITKLQDTQARVREPMAIIADTMSKLLDHFLGSNAKPGSLPGNPDTPVSNLVSGAVSRAYNEIPPPMRQELEYLGDKVGARKEQIMEAARSLNPDSNWRDVYNFIRRGFLDNSAKSSFQDASGKIHWNLNASEFHEKASKDPRYKKHYEGKTWK